MPHVQHSLFDAPEANRSLTVVDLVAQRKPQDKQQAAFQRLVKQIDDLRAQIDTWGRYRDHYQQRVNREMLPLIQQLREQRIAIVRQLDEQYCQPKLIRGKQLRRKLSELILEITRDLLAEGHDESLVALHDRYSDLSLAEETELDKIFSQELVQNMFGVELDDTDSAGSMEEMIARATAKLQQEAEQKAAQRPPRRKSAKTLAAEEKRAAAEKEVSQSVREVYRKLASTLHPDRASDNLSAAQKTALMQRVNRAYDSGNLLELLNIQLEIEQIDASHLANLPAERVAHYIHVLREQVRELKVELKELQAPYRALLSFSFGSKITPADVDKGFDQQVVELKHALRDVERDLQAWKDPKYLGNILKDYQPASDYDEFEALGQMLDAFAMHPPAQRKKPRKSRR